MRLHESDCDCHRHKDHEKGIIGESVDVVINNTCMSELRVDITVKEFESIRIWGQVKNCNGRPLAGVLIKLLRCSCDDHSEAAHTISDCQGFYQFDLCKRTAEGNYKIIASKASGCAKKKESCEHLNSENCCEQERCHQPACRCGQNCLCETCAYYNETLRTCCFPNRASVCDCKGCDV